MKLYNTLSRTTEDVQALNNNTIKLYTCGLTVYSQPHIGNWVGYIYWDVLVRTLRAAGFEVERTQNYTDVGHLVSDDDDGEDKMEKGARREGITAWDVAAKYIAIADHEAYDLLGLLRPEHLARATDYIQQQIAFTQALEQKGYTYSIPGEGIYFDTAKLPDYGKLARLDIDGLEAGARVAVEGKKNITDFALWKFSPDQAKRDMEWDSPWGKGFPGWHLECSVIARETLGDQIDMHTGGIDHIPVHHTNEIAQTEALTSKPFATYWLHNNHLKVDGGKMAKSVGNIYTLQDITDRGYELDAFRLLILAKHYRTEGNFTWEILEASQNALDGLNEWADLQFQQGGADITEDYAATLQTILDNLQNDLDTPNAIAAMHQLVRIAESKGSNAKEIAKAAASLDAWLGFSFSKRSNITAAQKALLERRQAARNTKEWEQSDTLRDELAAQGIGVRDTATGQVWYRMRS